MPLLRDEKMRWLHRKGCVKWTMDEPKMNRGLKNRHLQLISLGGIIGSGYFFAFISCILFNNQLI